MPIMLNCGYGTDKVMLSAGRVGAMSLVSSDLCAVAGKVIKQQLSIDNIIYFIVMFILLRQS